MKDRMLRPEEVGELIGRSRSWISEHSRSGDVECGVRIGKKVVVYPMSGICERFGLKYDFDEVEQDCLLDSYEKVAKIANVSDSLIRDYYSMYGIPNSIPKKDGKGFYISRSSVYDWLGLKAIWKEEV